MRTGRRTENGVEIVLIRGETVYPRLKLVVTSGAAGSQAGLDTSVIGFKQCECFQACVSRLESAMTSGAAGPQAEI